MRKASVFCLVAIYSVIGEELKPHLAQLTGSKVCIALHGRVVHLGLLAHCRLAALQLWAPHGLPQHVHSSWALFSRGVSLKTK